MAAVCASTRGDAGEHAKGGHVGEDRARVFFASGRGARTRGEHWGRRRESSS